MNRILMISLFTAGLAAQATPPHSRGSNLHTEAHQLAELTEVFEDAVDRRYHRSPVNRWADRLADRAEDFLDEVEDRDYRDMQEEFAELVRAYQRVAQAYGQCTLVPRDRYLAQLWQGITGLIRSISTKMNPRPVPTYPQPYPQPYPSYPQGPGHTNPQQPVHPGHSHPYGPGQVQPRLPRQPYPAQYSPRYPNPGQRQNPPGYGW